ncbi:MAG TPA: MATE family efflux transporter [Gaiellaceae bacterium]|nr:MATE family efflux transporter [Gaiellaceae bacterium]
MSAEGTARFGAEATTGSSVVRGGLWKMLSNALPQVYALVISIAAARYLGPDGMGRQSFIAFAELSVIELLTSGFAMSLQRYVGEAVGADQGAQARWLARAIFRILLVAAVLGGGVLVALGLLGREPRAAWVFAGLAVVSGVLASVPGAVLTGLQRWRDATLAGLVTGGLGAVATVVVLVLGGRISAMFAVEAGVLLLVLVWTGVLARSSLSAVSSELTPAPRLRRRSLRFAAYSSASGLLYLIVWRRSEFFFLNHYSPDSQIAFYSIAFALVSAVVRLPSAMGQVLAPAVATLLGAGAHDRIRRGFGRALRLLLVVTMPVAAATAALGPETIRLAWGADYAPAREPLLIMVAGSLLTPVTVLASSLLAGLERVKLPLAATAAAAAVDLGLAAALVPHHGAVGAAIANAAAQAAAGLPLIAYSARLAGPIRVGWGGLLRCAAFSAAGGAAAWGVAAVLGGVAGLILGLLAGTTLFLALGGAVGLLSREDAAWVAEVLGPRAGELPRRLVLALAVRERGRR